MKTKSFFTSFLSTLPLLTAVLMTTPVVAGDPVNTEGVSGIALGGYAGSRPSRPRSGLHAEANLLAILENVRTCTLCVKHLPLGPRPILQMQQEARILIAGQAPGRKVHESGIPFADASGNRLREWLGISSEVFYDPTQIAILPVEFCFPGTCKSGDLPPRVECAPAWRETLLKSLTHLRMTLVIGQYAQAYHLPNASGSVTSAVISWRDHWPSVVPLPHPSPRNNIWLRRNPWFEEQLLPELRLKIVELLVTP